MKRRIIRIDEEKCNGCGLCADACHEGAKKNATAAVFVLMPVMRGLSA